MFGPETLALLIPVIALMIPVVAILTRHQQRMVELMHGAGNNASTQEIAALREEVRSLREAVHTQMLAIDGMRHVPPPAPRVEERLRSE